MFATSLIRSSKRSTSFALSSLLTALLATSFVVLGGAVPASAAACDAGVAEPTLNEDGDTYTIGTAAELIALSENFDNVWGENLTFVQTADINLGGCDWSPIGTPDSPFYGVYRGEGFTVSGLRISETTADNVGFFGYIDDESYIRELTLIGEIDIPLGSVAGGSTVGAIAGYIEGEAYVSQVLADVDISIRTIGSGAVGGLVGWADYGNVMYSAHRGDIYVTGSKVVGGLVGFIKSNLEILSSYSIATFDVTSLSVYTSGGIIGNADCEADPLPLVTRTFSVASGQHYAVQFDNCATYVDSYYNATVFPGAASSDGSIVGATNENTANLKAATLFQQDNYEIIEGWQEFQRFKEAPLSIWGICSAVNDGYPYLLWEYSSNPCVSGGSGNSALASTGSNLGDYSGLVAGVLMAGTGLVLLGRLRRRSKSHV